MRFIVDFNIEGDDKFLEDLGCIKQEEHYGNYHNDYYFLDINKLEELEILHEKLWSLSKIYGKQYSMIVGFDHPTIFLDEDI